MDIINKNALYREFLVRHGNLTSYSNIAKSLSGNGDLSEKERRQLLKIIDEAFDEIKKNISKSLTTPV